MLYKNYATHCDQLKRQTEYVQFKVNMSLYQCIHGIFEPRMANEIAHKMHNANKIVVSSLPLNNEKKDQYWLKPQPAHESTHLAKSMTCKSILKQMMRPHNLGYMKKILFSFLLASAFSSSYGVDFGSHGNVFVIQEEDARETFIKSAARVDWEGPREKIRESIVELKANKQNKRALYPPNEDIITFIDPSITAQRDIYAPYIKEGQVERELLIAKGTKINPLDYMQPSTHRLFINSEDPYQLEFLTKMVNIYNVALQIIVINGSTEEVEKISKINVFQASDDLLEKNNIDFTPSIVSVSNHPDYLKRMQVTSLARPFSTERLIELITYE